MARSPAMVPTSAVTIPANTAVAKTMTGRTNGPAAALRVLALGKFIVQKPPGDILAIYACDRRGHGWNIVSAKMRTVAMPGSVFRQRASYHQQPGPSEFAAP